MTTEEKIYLRKLLTTLYYNDVDAALYKLCHMAGWVPFEAGGNMPEEQQKEIEYYLFNMPVKKRRYRKRT